ncbi:uncharacterized protein LOC119602434 isoform X1 [Lucilia sericata]|uniref:uncharacterized protein LOC119602434 isoform X1 n=1 Tax=Lucilia sericata TaxID=13632 RepID=UPI0018A823EC|nr:uncharacterized protein LOC119602434 isoform X1 [Lucilia sericata]XP_037809878.1 uncharacterized protein LOC119602434 isoform X1 [Lucilia sericata]XP_037809879.1 uncharacterized protein LOC119602434 isoform X1 [Lucilia sericata]
MKLTICQFGKLFLLLTAFFFVTKSFQILAVDAAATASTFVTPGPIANKTVTVAIETSVKTDAVGSLKSSNTNTLVEQDIERKFEIVTQQPTTKSIIKTNNNRSNKVKSQVNEKTQQLQHQTLINNTFNVLSNKVGEKLENITLKGNENQTATTLPTTKIFDLPATKLQQTVVNGLLAKPYNTQPNANNVDYNNNENHVHDDDDDDEYVKIKSNVSRQMSDRIQSSSTTHVTHLNQIHSGQTANNEFLLQQTKIKQQKRIKPQFNKQPLLRSSTSSSYSSVSASAVAAIKLNTVSSASTSLLPLRSQYNQKQQDYTSFDLNQYPFRQQSQQLEHQKISSKTAASAKTLPSLSSSSSASSSGKRVGILMPSRLLNRMHVQQGFRNFVEFFQVNLNNVSVDFIPDDDLTTFIKLLEQPNYTTLVKTLNAGINLDDDNDDLVEGAFFKPQQHQRNHQPTEPHKNQPSNKESQENQTKDEDMNMVENKNEKVKLKDNENKNYEDLQNQKHSQATASASASAAASSSMARNEAGGLTKESIEEEQQQQDKHLNIGYCHLTKALERDFNKTVFLWPCPHMKESSNFLPSYEAISFAVKSIATKLNWTKVDIYIGDENWALPMAIAANMHVPYKIEIGEDDIRDLNAEDKIGKAIIITAAMNDVTTLRLLSLLETLIHTKVLLIDIVATSFNAENRFYKYLTRIKPESQLMSNLLLLTILSDNYRYFLNVAFDNNGIEMVQNFRQQKLEREKEKSKQAQPNNWPIHLDESVTEVLQLREDSNNKLNRTISAEMAKKEFLFLQQLLKECSVLNVSATNINLLCINSQHIKENCLNEKQQLVFERFCQNHNTFREQQLIENLRNFIDFFNFYDFLIANILNSTPAEASTISSTASKSLKHVPKYDFIVLDVVRGIANKVADATSHISVTNDTTSSNMFDFINGKHQLELQYYSLTNTTKSSSSSSTPSSSSLVFKWRPLLILEQHEINLKTYITHSILPGYDDWLLVSTAQLWYCGSICWTIIAICVGVLLVIVVASVAAGIAMRNYLLRKRLSKGPNKIVLSANDFVFPVDSRRVDEGIEAMLCCWLQQLQEFGGPEVDKPDLLKGSIGSLKNLGFIIPGAANNSTTATVNGKTSSGSASLARHNPALLDMRARYNGDLVQLKEVPLNGSNELKAKAMDLLVMAHGLRHENINPLIGWLADPSRTAMVFDYCSRGSLQDVLIMDEIKLDWSFRLSLLTDLVRGMRYLHASPLRVHGTLTSRNCVVDARWVLKITDYGLPLFYEAQGLTLPPRNYKELLWTAPELLRSLKPQNHQHHHHHHHGARILGTQAGDVYSFGIIMQEVVVRGEPYCMLSLSAEEIIAKIKKPPPLIRPSVSKGAAPPEAINIMRQCWAEQPEMRPDFNSVYERFKLLNHGRKVNFVDTMFQMLEKYSNNLEELIRERTEQLDIERKKTEQLLNRMLPSSVAEKLKMGLAVEPEEFSDVTIYFSDIVGFTTIAAHCTPVQVVDLLNDLYTIFDATINAYNVYKVETIGDAYMVVSGIPVRTPDHAEQIATMALDLLHQSGRFNVKHLPGVPLQLRIGLHTGPCCAGVVGLTMPRYCLFGDTVNTASRMESTGSSWRIHMSQETRNRLEARGGYMIEPRGLIDIKGKGMMNTFWLLGKKGFDKPLPNPPPIGESHGLDESLIRNSITLKAQANKSRNSTNPSSSQSSSLAGESVEVKVEITPPTNVDVCSSSNLPNSYSLDSNSTNTISPNMTLCPEFPTKTPSNSPQPRKITDIATDNLLNPSNFNRLPTSAAGSSSRLYKKIEEMMDLSSPYNHYKCLSPSESNLTQFYDGKYLYSSGVGGVGTTAANSFHSVTGRFEKPGSSRLLRRQFSLDRDDTQSKSEHQHHQHHQSSLQSSLPLSLSNKSSTLEIPILHDTARSPKGTLTRVHKQNSTSIAQDLEKIEEIPLSPASSQQHSSLDSNINRSPPSTIEAQSPPVQNVTKRKSGLLTSMSPPPTLLSAPTSPAPSRSLNGVAYNCTIMESPTTDASTATTTASVNSNTTTPIEEPSGNLKKPEIMLNVEALISR